MPSTKTPPALTPPGIDSQPALRGLKLSQEWTIGEPIPRGHERHSAVYSVLISETGQVEENLEAHVFSLHDIEPKLRKYRQRCIKRMKGRTKLKVEVENFTVVVITTSQTENVGVFKHRGEPQSLDKDGQHETDTGTTSIGEATENMVYRVEFQQIRQRERCQAKRIIGTRQDSEISGHIAQEIDMDSSPEGNNHFSTFTFLVNELLDGWDWWQISAMYTSLAKNEDSSCFHEVYAQYLLQTAAALQKLEELESYLKVKRSEIIVLRSLRAGMMR